MGNSVSNTLRNTASIIKKSTATKNPSSFSKNSNFRQSPPATTSSHLPKESVSENELASEPSLKLLPSAYAIRARHILFSSLNQAQNALDEITMSNSFQQKNLNSKSNDDYELKDQFSFIAKSKSQCPSGLKSGGYLGWIHPGQLSQDIQDKLFTAEPNKAFLVSSKFGFHLFEILERAEPDLTSISTEKDGKIDESSEKSPDTVEGTDGKEYGEMLKKISNSITSKTWKGVTVLHERQILNKDQELIIDHGSSRRKGLVEILPKDRDAGYDEEVENIEGRLNENQIRAVLKAENVAELIFNQKKFNIDQSHVKLLMKWYAFPTVVSNINQKSIGIWNDPLNTESGYEYFEESHSGVTLSQLEQEETTN